CIAHYFFFLFFPCFHRHRYLHSFPTRRSSDLVSRSRDRWRGLITGFLKWRFDLLNDHSIGLYAKHIVTAINEENAGLPSKRDKRSEEHTSELQSQSNLVCRLLLEKKKKQACKS